MEVPGLTIASNQDVFLNGIELIIFFHGKYDSMGTIKIFSQVIWMLMAIIIKYVLFTTHQKNLGCLHYPMIYPFTKKCMTHYGWDGFGEMSDYLKATGQMDSTNE